MPGFSVVRNDRGSGRGGGVCIFYRNNLRPERLRVPTTGSQLETLWMSFGRNHRVTVGVAYRPPRGAVLPYIEDLRTQLVHVMGLGRPVCLLGDMNFDLLSPVKPGVANYVQLLSELNLCQLIKHQTHRDGSLLDHIIIPESDVTATARVVPFHSSDHDLVVANLTIRVERSRREEITVRSSRRLDPDALRYDLLTADWTSLYALPGVQNKWRSFLDVWSPIIDRHMPFVTVKLRHPPCPWLDDNPYLREMMRERDVARAERDRDRCDRTESRYRQCRNEVKVAQCRARSAFFEGSLKNSRKQTWNDIRKFLVSSGKRGGRDGGLPVTDHTLEWADKLNRHFSSVGPSIAASLATVAATGPLLSPRPPRVCSDAFRVKPATLPELSSALKRMSCSKASGSDGITVSMLKMTFPVVGPHLLHVINRSIVEGVLPAEWKVASVTPLFKSGDILDTNNYRPVSILPTVSKLAERVVCDQLMCYLTSCSIICPEQHGFRPAHSTESAMLDAVSYISSKVDGGQVVSLIAADTFKAFDSVEHGRLLEKLGWYGVDPWWLADWLNDRKQTVKGGSGPLPVSHGVVQGSILGPILFTIFTNDLPSHIPCGKLVMYADDTQFLTTCNQANLGEHSADLEAMLGVVQAWYNQNSLRINPNMTELILFGANCTTDFSIQFAGALEKKSTEKVKILGVVVDSRLQWVDHVSLVVRRCYSTLSGLAKFSHRLPSSVKRLIVQSLVFPHIVYCVSVWGGCNKTQKHRVQKKISTMPHRLFRGVHAGRTLRLC